MRAPGRGRVAPRDESGAVLVFALVVVTVVALAIGAVLTFADTSVRTTLAVRAQNASATTADGAAQAAIGTLKRNGYDNDTSSGSAYPKCFGSTASSDQLVLPSLIPGATGSAANSAVVQCSPMAGTGVDGGVVPITDANKPGQAILTLSRNTSEDGLYVKPLSNSQPFTVHGGVVSNSDIVVDNGTMNTNTDVYAHTGCFGTVQADGTKKCDAGTVDDPAVAHPAQYTPAATTLPAYRPVPTTCPNGVVTFSPGFYNDAKALSDLMSGNGPCAGSIWWFAPDPAGTTGVYYFDFENTVKGGGMANPHQWLVKDGKLLAGTPTSKDPVTGLPKSSTAIPGGCVNPIDDTTAVGVQFVFGGDSQFAVDGSADAEICGTYDPNRPPIAVYGLKTSGTPTTTTVTGATATSVSSQANAFKPPSGNDLATPLKTADKSYDAYKETNKNGGSGQLTLSPFVPPGGVPATSDLQSASLRITYGASPAATARTVTVTPTYSTGPGAPFTLDVPGGTSTQDDGTQRTVDLTAALHDQVAANGLKSLSVEYDTTLPGTGTEQIDAVMVDLTYTGATLRGETTAAVPGNCLAIPYTSGAAGTGRCALIYSPSSHSGKFYIQGTTYAPLAPIDLTLSNISEQVMRFGVISRTLAIKETGSFGYSGPVIEIPDNSLGYGQQGAVVYLNVYVCENSSTCSTSTGRLRLRAKVYIKDPDNTRQMIVQSWAVQR